jgi:hypothetical protein
MVKVIQYRFRVFRTTFGRNPLPNEPIFFAEDCLCPRTANNDQLIAQLAQAAEATMVPLPPLLRLLGLE